MLRGRLPEPAKWDAVAWLEENPDRTQQEAADRFGISRQLVQQTWVKKHGSEPTPYTKRKRELRARAIELAREGHYAAEIARQIGVAATSVASWCRAAGVELAPPPRKATAEALSTALSAIAAGESIAVAASAAGITYSYLQKIMHRHGVTSGARGGGRNGLCAIASEVMDREGASLEIAAMCVGCAPHTLRVWRARRGLPTKGTP